MVPKVYILIQNISISEYSQTLSSVKQIEVVVTDKSDLDDFKKHNDRKYKLSKSIEASPMVETWNGKKNIRC